jgi:hypothetical protein
MLFFYRSTISEPPPADVQEPQWNSPRAQRYPRHTVTSWTTSSSVSSGGGEGGKGVEGEGRGEVGGGVCMPGPTAQISGLFQKHFRKVSFPN